MTWSVHAGPPAASFDDGVYFLRAEVTDQVTRRFTSAPLRFIKATDAANPTVGFTTSATTPKGTTPANNATIMGATMPTITGVAADTGGSGVSKVELQLYRATATVGVNEYWNGTAWVVSSSTIPTPNLSTVLNPAGGGVSVSWSRSSGWPTDTKYGNGVYYLRAFATDRVDRRTASVASRFTKATATSAMPQQDAPTVIERVSDVQLSSAVAHSSGPSIELVFIGALDLSVAQESGHYAVQVNGKAVAVESATYSAASKTVTLELPSTALNAGDEISVTVSGLQDNAGAPFTIQSAQTVAR